VKEIRSSILEGDIDRAFKYTTVWYPNVIADNPEIVFRLKCRKYVEMIRRCSELHTPKSAEVVTSDLYLTKATTNTNATANGHTDVFDEDMELDDENDNENDSFQTTNTSNGNSLTDEDDEEEEDDDDDEQEGVDFPNLNIPTENPTNYDDLLQEAMSYGQTLMREYRDEKREYRKTLEDIFSLIAYDDAKASVHGHLLETGGRVQVAEELNSAILGKSSS
jgi:Ran-binding protein 9/10